MIEFDEGKLIDKIKQGDQEAFGELYERYVNRIYNYIYYRTGNSADAEDLTARVFLRAMDHIGNYQNLGLPFSAWLYRIAHNLVANWHRDNQRRQELPLEDTTDMPHKDELPEAQILRNQEKEHLLTWVRSLPTDRQQLVILKFVEGLSNVEIATIMGRSEGAIKSLYHRTLVELRDHLETSAVENEYKA